MAKKRYTVAQVEEALRKNAGIITAAAKALGCERNTVYAYVQRHPRLQKAREEATEATLDLAESKLVQAIGSGKLPAIFFYLKCKGKERGWIERKEVTGKDGAPLNPADYEKDLVTLTKDEREQLRAIAEGAATRSQGLPN